MKTNANLAKCLEMGSRKYSMDSDLKELLNQGMIHNAPEAIQFVKRILNEVGDEYFKQTRDLLPVAEKFLFEDEVNMGGKN